jgi:hypothetical protein
MTDTGAFFLSPIPVSEAWLQEHNIRPQSKDLLQTHHPWIKGPSGLGYLVTSLSYYPGYPQKSIHTVVVNVFDAHYKLIKQEVLSELTPDLSRDILTEGYFTVNVNGAGEVVFCTGYGRNYVYDEMLENCLKRLEPTEEEAPGFSRFACFASGKVVGLRGKNALCLESGEVQSTMANGLPETRHLALVYADDTGAPSLKAYKRGGRQYLGSLSTIGDKRFLLPVLSGPMRSGDGAVSEYLVFNQQGEGTGFLAHRYEDDPSLPRDYPNLLCHGHDALDGWLMKTLHAFHVFGPDGGSSLLRLTTREEPDYKELKSFVLSGVGHQGELIFVHPKQHTLLITPPVTALEQLSDVLKTASQGYRPTYNKLKKAVSWVKDAFLASPEEPLQLMAPKKKAKKSKTTNKEPLPVFDGRWSEELSDDLAVAICQRPRELELRKAYAEQLMAEDKPLGDYIQLCCELHEMGEGEADKSAALQSQKQELEEKHLKQWLHRWSSSRQQFGSGALLFGMPGQVSIDKMPKDLESFDETLCTLPISELFLSRLRVKEIQSFAETRLFRRVSLLQIWGSNKTNLGRSTLETLAAASLVQLETLHLYEVTSPGDALVALLETLPSLKSLSLHSTDLSEERFLALSSASTVPSIESLSLRSQPLRGLRGLEQWTGLKTLKLVGCELRDEITEAGSITLPVQELELESNPELSTTGFGWLLDSCPVLHSLTLPPRIKPEALEKLSHCLDSLKSLKLSELSDESLETLLESLLPRTTCLQTLVLDSRVSGLMERILDKVAVSTLVPGKRQTDADLVALVSHSNAEALRTLTLTGEFTNKGLQALASSERLGALRNLSIESSLVTAEGLMQLVNSDKLGALRKLHVRHSFDQYKIVKERNTRKELKIEPL